MGRKFCGGWGEWCHWETRLTLLSPHRRHGRQGGIRDPFGGWTSRNQPAPLSLRPSGRVVVPFTSTHCPPHGNCPYFHTPGMPFTAPDSYPFLDHPDPQRPPIRSHPPFPTPINGRASPPTPSSQPPLPLCPYLALFLSPIVRSSPRREHLKEEGGQNGRGPVRASGEAAEVPTNRGLLRRRLLHRLRPRLRHHAPPRLQLRPERPELHAERGTATLAPLSSPLPE